MELAVICVWFGLWLAYKIFKAIGWLCIPALILLSPLNSSATWNFTMHFGSSVSSVSVFASGAGCAVCSGGVVGSPTGSGTTWNQVMNYCGVSGAMYFMQISSSGCNSNICVTGPTADGQTIDVYVCGAVSAPPTYYANGCTTNTTFQPRRVTVNFYLDSGGSLAGGTLDQSHLLLPGEGWCFTPVSSTNHFNYTLYQQIYDGEGNLLSETVGGPFPPTGTNAPGGNNITYVAGPPGATGNPVTGQGNDGAPLGGNSNTNLTGSQFNQGMTNLQNSIFYGLQNLLGGVSFALASNALSAGSIAANGVNGTNAGYLDAFQKIASRVGSLTNSADGISNLLRQIKQNTGGDMTNGQDFSAFYNGGGFGSGSNALWGGGIQSSNDFYTNVSGAVGDSLLGTNVAGLQPGDISLWVIANCPTNLGSGGFMGLGTTTGNLDLNPRHSRIWQLAPYILVLFTWLIACMFIRAMQVGIVERMTILMLIPGAGPGKGTFSWLTWSSSNAAFALAMGAIPIIVGAGIQTVMRGHSFDGGPLSATTITNNSGIWAPAIRLAIDILQDCFPLIYFFSTATYFFFWCLALDAMLLWGARFLRAIGN